MPRHLPQLFVPPIAANEDSQRSQWKNHRLDPHRLFFHSLQAFASCPTHSPNASGLVANFCSYSASLYSCYLARLQWSAKKRPGIKNTRHTWPLHSTCRSVSWFCQHFVFLQSAFHFIFFASAWLKNICCKKNKKRLSVVSVVYGFFSTLLQASTRKKSLLPLAPPAVCWLHWLSPRSCIFFLQRSLTCSSKKSSHVVLRLPCGSPSPFRFASLLCRGWPHSQPHPASKGRRWRRFLGFYWCQGFSFSFTLVKYNTRNSQRNRSSERSQTTKINKLKKGRKNTNAAHRTKPTKKTKRHPP